MKHHLMTSCVAAVLGLGVFHSFSAVPGVGESDGDFTRDIKPILELYCVKCHGPERPKGGLRLDSRAGAILGGYNGAALVPGKTAMSKLSSSTTLATDADEVMPPKKEPKLSQAQTASLKAWIEQGARWPEGVTLVAVKRVDFVKDIQPILEFNCVA